MRLIYTLGVITIFICGFEPISSISYQKEGKSEYLITELDSINNVFIIYAERKDSIFKIVSKKETVEYCNSILIGCKYELELISSFTPKKYYNMVHLDGMKYEDAVIELEDKNNIVRDIFETENLTGLCYLE